MKIRIETLKVIAFMSPALLAVLMMACEAGPPVGVTPPVDGVVSFAQHVQPIFDAKCTSCHRAGSPSNAFFIPLILTEGDSYDMLVNQPSSQESDLTLVVPGDSNASLLYQKISSTSPPVGSRMPLLRSPLNEVDIGLIRDWIDQGAANN